MNIRTSYFFVLVAAAAFAATGCAVDTGPAVEVMMDPDAPVTEAPPVYAVGSSWTVDVTVNGETVRDVTTIIEKREIDGREVDVHAQTEPSREPGGACDGANGRLHDAVTHNWMACMKDGEILGSLSPHNGQYEWPLEVGKSWRSQRTWTDNVNPESSGPGWEEFTVVAWEEVTVPAGTFMAYKVTRTKTSWQSPSDEVSVTWYAPEYGGGVKGMYSFHTGSGLVEVVYEVVSNDPKFPAES